jgi:tRNA-intron endonuclease, archaea type
LSGTVGRDARGRVSDPTDASTLYGRGFFGTIVANGALELDRYETLYLTEMHRVELSDGRRPVPWPEIFRRAQRAEPGFGVRYVVYRDLRQRGYVVRASPPPAAFSVLPRGGILHKTPARFWVQPYSERVPFDLAALFDLAARAQSAKKSLLLALVDEESDLTYYRVRRPAPTGALPARKLEAPAQGYLSEDRVTVFDPTAVEELGKGLAYGSRVGERLELSLIEAQYLVESGQLTLVNARSGRRVSAAALARTGHRVDPRFFERAAAYRTLRSHHLVVKTGFKYGAHFRAYPRSPEHAHARYLIQAVPASHVATWPEVAGGIRVAQGVRKEFLVAGVSPQADVKFLALERIRP